MSWVGRNGKKTGSLCGFHKIDWALKRADEKRGGGQILACTSLGLIGKKKGEEFDLAYTGLESTESGQPLKK